MTKSKIFNLTAWYGVSIVLIRAINFLLLPVYSNIFSAEEFGMYALILTLYSFAAAAYQFGLQNSLTKYFIDANSDEEKKKVFSTVFNFACLLSLVLTAGGLYFADSFSSFLLNTADHGDLIILVFVILPIETLGYFALHLSKVLENSKFVVFASAVAAVINFAGNILFVVEMQIGIAGIFFAQLFSALVLFVIAFTKIFRWYKFVFDRGLMRELSAFATPIFAGGLFAVLIDYADRILIDRLLDRASVGLYSLSYRIAFVMNVFVIAFRTAWTPRSLNEFNNGNYEVHFGKVFEKLLALGSVIFVSISVLAPHAFGVRIFGKYLLTPEYAGGAVIIPFILAAYFFSGLSSFYSVYPFASGKSFHFFIVEVVGLSVNIGLNFVFIPVWGIAGAAAATLFSFAAGSFYLFLISRTKVIVKYSIANILLIVFVTSAVYLAGNLIDSLILHIFIIAAISGLFLVKFKSGLLPENLS